MQAEPRFIGRPAPAPPRITNSTGGLWRSGPRSLPLPRPGFPTSAAGGSFPLPPIPPLPPKLLPALGAGLPGLGALLLLELLFPAPLADGTLPDQRATEPSSGVDPGLQPTPEREPISQSPVTSVSGDWLYDGVKTITITTEVVSYNERYGILEYLPWTSFTQYYDLRPKGSSINVYVENLRADYIFDCPDCDGSSSTPHIIATEFDHNFAKQSEKEVGADGGRIELGYSQVGWSTTTSWISDVTYWPATEFEPDAYPPGPVLPQPLPTFPSPESKPASRLSSFAQVTTEALTLETSTTTTDLVGPSPRRSFPLPTQPEPEVAPEPEPETQPFPNRVPATEPLPNQTTPVPLPVPNVPRTSVPMPDNATAPLPQVPRPGITPPDWHFPVPGGPGIPGNGPPPTEKGISEELGRLEGKGNNTLERLANIAELLGFLGDILGDGDREAVDPDTYLLQGFCEEPDDQGNQPVFSTPVLGGSFQTAAISRLDAMQYLLQAHLGYKTPTCSATRPKLEGDWRTISFVSDEISPLGDTRLRKRLRYRSSNSVGLDGLVDHWRDFFWQAGPVCVKHVESSWGTITVWAASANEGKRVIRHAAGEAGIDPDQDGRWIVGGSNSSRLGMPGTMRVDTRGGVYRITARDGSDGPPMAAIQSYDL